MSDTARPTPVLRLAGILTWLATMLPTRAGMARAFWRFPVIGRIAREVVHGPRENLWYLLAGVACLWLMAVMTWGLVAVVITAVLAAPVLLAMLVLISMG